MHEQRQPSLGVWVGWETDASAQAWNCHPNASLSGMKRCQQPQVLQQPTRALLATPRQRASWPHPTAAPPSAHLLLLVLRASSIHIPLSTQLVLRTSVHGFALSKRYFAAVTRSFRVLGFGIQGLYGLGIQGVRVRDSWGWGFRGSPLITHLGSPALREIQSDRLSSSRSKSSGLLRTEAPPPPISRPPGLRVRAAPPPASHARERLVPNQGAGGSRCAVCLSIRPGFPNALSSWGNPARTTWQGLPSNTEQESQIAFALQQEFACTTRLQRLRVGRELRAPRDMGVSRSGGFRV
jgi:hypothetical protein